MPVPLNPNHEMLMALRNGRWARAGRMLMQGASPQAVGRHQETALHHLARCLRPERDGHEQAHRWAQRMVQGGTPLNALNRDGVSALTLAMGPINRVMNVLLDAGADPNAGSDAGVAQAQNALVAYVRYGHGGVIQRWLQAGFDLHRQVPITGDERFTLDLATTAAHLPAFPDDRPLGLLERLASDRQRGWGDLLSPGSRHAVQLLLDAGLLDRAGPARSAKALVLARAVNPLLAAEFERWSLRTSMHALPAESRRAPRRL